MFDHEEDLLGDVLQAAAHQRGDEVDLDQPGHAGGFETPFTSKLILHIMSLSKMEMKYTY